MLREYTNDIRNLPKALEPVRVIEFFDIPLLSEYKAAEGGIYISKWCDRDTESNRYLIVKSDLRSVAEYLAQKISMLKLLKSTSDGFGFIVDIGFDSTTRHVYPITFAQLPEVYLPSIDAVHSVDLRPEWNISPVNYLVNREWDVKLFANVEKILTTAAGFAYFTKPGTGRKIPITALNYVYNSGYSYGELYNRMRTMVPLDKQSRSVGIAAASPGVLTINSPTEIIDHIAKCLDALSSSESYISTVSSWSRSSINNCDLIPDSSFEDLQALCLSMHVDINSLFPEPSTANPNPYLNKQFIHTAAKLIASYIKTLRLLKTPEQGVELISLPIVPSQSSSHDDNDDDEDDNE